MKIATWNIERPAKNGKKTAKIIKVLRDLNADILVLTETNDFIDLGVDYTIHHTSILQDKMYNLGERRVSIFSKFPLADNTTGFETFNAASALCVNLKTSFGELTVYGTIIGILGNGGIQFRDDLEKQLLDFKNINKQTKNFCIIGDLNISFTDNYYFTKLGRDKLNTLFEEQQIKNFTADLKHNIDHIILTEKFVGKRRFIVSHWNETENKQTRLSDHKGVMIEILE
jgi:endonuclease/exonuclease/phosphatase family metal-dependent hydrolase